MNLRNRMTDQQGIATLLVLGFMVLVVPAMVAALSFVATASTTTRVERQNTLGLYNAIGGVDHALYKLEYDATYFPSLIPDVPDTYSINLNTSTVDIIVERLTNADVDPPEASFDQNQRLRALKAVSPATVAADTLTTYSYTVTVLNGDTVAHGVNQIIDLLPPGFTYDTGTTTGVTTDEPTITGQEAEWDIASLGILIQPQDSIVLNFDATATLAEGVYCNEAWVQPGNENTTSGKSAKITAGSPASAVCAGAWVDLTKVVTPTSAIAGDETTFTYLITLDNVGQVDVNISQVRDFLPGGFDYQTGTTTGNMTTSDPAINVAQNRLTWSFTPSALVASGTTATIQFDAKATVAPAIYWNTVDITTDSNGTFKTGNTAPVWVLAPVAITSEDSQVRAIARVWISDGFNEVTHFQVDHK